MISRRANSLFVKLFLLCVTAIGELVQDNETLDRTRSYLLNTIHYYFRFTFTSPFVQLHTHEPERRCARQRFALVRDLARLKYGPFRSNMKGAARSGWI